MGEYLDLMRGTKELPQASQLAPVDFIEVYRELVDVRLPAALAVRRVLGRSALAASRAGIFCHVFPLPRSRAGPPRPVWGNRLRRVTA